MFKLLFPLIFALALELTPVIKTYENIKNQYGQNLGKLIPNLTSSINGKELPHALANQFEKFENAYSEEKPKSLNYWF